VYDFRSLALCPKPRSELPQPWAIVTSNDAVFDENIPATLAQVMDTLDHPLLLPENPFEDEKAPSAYAEHAQRPNVVSDEKEKKAALEQKAKAKKEQEDQAKLNEQKDQAKLNAQESEIKVSSVSATHNFSNDYNCSNLINGKGLDAEQKHSTTYSDMWLAEKSKTPELTFDLGGAKTVGQLHVYQYSYGGNTSRGVKTFKLLCDGKDAGTYQLKQYDDTMTKGVEILLNSPMTGTIFKFVDLYNHGDGTYVGLSLVKFISS
jgi:hypothetical protein